MPVEVLQRAYLLDTYYLPMPEDDVEAQDPTLDEAGDLAEAQDPTLVEDDDLAEAQDLTLVEDLDASITQQDYLTNLKPFKRFPFRIKKSDVLLEPRWAKVPKESAPVNHNHQHDLESIWWILLWIITCRIGPEKSAVIMKKYFRHRLEDFPPRQKLFEKFLNENKAGLRKDLYQLWSHLRALRKSMETAYLLREVFGHLEVPEAYSRIQVEFSKRLRVLQGLKGSWRSIALQSNSSAAQKATIGKRERELTAEDPSAEQQSQPKRIRLKF